MTAADELYTLCATRFHEAEKLGAYNDQPDGRNAHFLDPRLGVISLASHTQGSVVRYNFAFGSFADSVIHCVTSGEVGVLDGGSTKLDDLVNRAIDHLTKALVVPRLERFFGFGVDASGHAKSLHYVSSVKQSGINALTYVLPGSRPLGFVHRTGQYDLRQWWGLVRQGKIVDVTKAMANSPKPIKGDDGPCGFLLFQEGDRFYCKMHATHQLTLEQAQSYRSRKTRRDLRQFLRAH